LNILDIATAPSEGEQPHQVTPPESDLVIV
jgi:hypothetical protein